MVIAVITGITILRQPKALDNAVLRYLGTISYSLYLLHASIGYVIIKSAYSRGLSGEAGVLIAIATAFTLGSLNAFLIEKPANQFLRRLYDSMKQSGQLASVAPTNQGN